MSFTALSRGQKIGASLVALVLAAGLVAAINALTASTSAATPSTKARETFAGVWHVHDGDLIISRQTGFDGKAFWSAQSTDNLGSDLDIDLLQPTLLRNHTLKVRVFGVGFVNQHGVAIRDPTPGTNYVQGDWFVLKFVRPHLLKMVDIHTRHHGVIGNPYWCGPGLPPKYQLLCGA